MIVATSLYDPVLSQEGTLDPLGLTPISERIAGKLVPGIRERMSHPRYLTPIAAGAQVCKPFLDRIAVDGISEPYMVFEWYVVQGFFKVYQNQDDQILGLPGKLKAREAWLKKDPLSNKRYLKVASTFGVHGVYRTLANDLDIIMDNELGENGDRLLRVWEEEQGKKGFISQSTGPGRDLLHTLRKAVDLGLSAGEVAYPWSWKGFDAIAPLFAPYRAGANEKKLINELLLSDKKGFRQVILETIPQYLDSLNNDEPNEKLFHDFLINDADQDLKEMLRTIQVYEKFSRILTNLFYRVLQYLSNKNRKVAIKEIRDQVPVNTDFSAFHSLYEEVGSRLRNYGEDLVFEEIFRLFGSLSHPDELFSALIQHHNKIQQRKPPFGKMPWLESFEDGHYMIRPLYRQDQYELPDEDYVNAYRMWALIPFFNDLKV